MTDAAPAGDAQVTTVTVRYWAAVRAASGLAEEQVDAVTLADLLAEVRRRHRDRDRFSDVLAICSVLVSEVPVGTRDPAEVRFEPGDVVELLPPFAGG